MEGITSMIMFYVEGFIKRNSTVYYNNLKLFRNFDEYLESSDAKISTLHQYVEDYIDGLSYATTTKKNYRGVLRRFVRYIYNIEGIVLNVTKPQVVEEPEEEVIYILHKDGSYELMVRTNDS